MINIHSAFIIVPFLLVLVFDESNCQLSIMPTVSPIRLFGTITGASSVIPTYKRLVKQFTNSVGRGTQVTLDSPYSRYKSRQLEKAKQRQRMQWQASNVHGHIAHIPPRVGQVMMTEPLLEVDSDEHLVTESMNSQYADTVDAFNRLRPMLQSFSLPKSMSIIEVINGKVLPNGEKIKFMYPIRVLDANTIFEPDEWHDSPEALDSGALLSPSAFAHSEDH